MLLCHCKVVSDREISNAIDAGARDEFDIAEACGAGTVCGGCLPAIGAMLDERVCATRCPVGSALEGGRAAIPQPALEA